MKSSSVEMNIHSWQGLAADIYDHKIRYLDQRSAQNPKCIVLSPKHVDTPARRNSVQLLVLPLETQPVSFGLSLPLILYGETQLCIGICLQICIFDGGDSLLGHAMPVDRYEDALLVRHA